MFDNGICTDNWQWDLYWLNSHLMAILFLSGMCHLSSYQCMTLKLVILTSQWLASPLRQCCGEANESHEVSVACFLLHEGLCSSLCVFVCLGDSIYWCRLENCQCAFQMLRQEGSNVVMALLCQKMRETFLSPDCVWVKDVLDVLKNFCHLTQLELVDFVNSSSGPFLSQQWWLTSEICMQLPEWELGETAFACSHVCAGKCSRNTSHSSGSSSIGVICLWKMARSTCKSKARGPKDRKLWTSLCLLLHQCECGTRMNAV